MTRWHLAGQLLEAGAVVLSLVIAVAFLKLGARSGDRLYRAFAVAFILLGSSWALLFLRAATGDDSHIAFVPRVAAFATIIGAIIDKNRRAHRRRVR